MRLVGFPLVDLATNGTGVPPPAEALQITATNASPLAGGLGLEYNGSMFGANVSLLAAHGGVDLGFDTVANGSGRGASVRTSISYVPVGNGSVYYFGGAVVDPAGAYVPEGGVRLANDIGQLLAFPLVPAPGPVVTEELNLTAYQQTSVVLRSNTTGAPVGLLVECSVAGAPLFELAQQLVPTPPSNSSATSSGWTVLVTGTPSVRGAPATAGCSACGGAPTSAPRTLCGRVPPAGGATRSLLLSRSTSTG
jgi:hypothetical protein